MEIVEHEYFVTIDEDGHFALFHLWYEREELYNFLESDMIASDQIANGEADLEVLDHLMQLPTPMRYLKGIKTFLYQAGLCQRGSGEIITKGPRHRMIGWREKK